MALYRGSTKLAGIGAGFVPENSGTTGQVLTKTSTGYNYQDKFPSGGNNGDVLTNVSGTPTWQAPASSGIICDPSSPITITKIRAGTQSVYENLGTYDSSTAYLII